MIPTSEMGNIVYSDWHLQNKIFCLIEPLGAFAQGATVSFNKILIRKKSEFDADFELNHWKSCKQMSTKMFYYIKVGELYDFLYLFWYLFWWTVLQLVQRIQIRFFANFGAKRIRHGSTIEKRIL